MAKETEETHKGDKDTDENRLHLGNLEKHKPNFFQVYLKFILSML